YNKRSCGSGGGGSAPPAPRRPDAASPLYTAAGACRSARWLDLGCGSRVLRGRGPENGRWWQAGEGRWHLRVPRLRMHVTAKTPPRGVGLVERVYLWAPTGRGHGWWHRRQLEMPQDAGDHRLLGDDRNDPQRPLMAKRAGSHVQPKDAAQQLGPRPVRGARVYLLPV